MSDQTKKTIIDTLKTMSVFQSSLGSIKVTGPLLGQGGNGLVYPVQFSGDIDAVAKFLSEPVTERPSTQEVRFLDEYRRLVAVPPHPHLIRLYHFDHITLGGIKVPVILMERGLETLKNKVEREKKLTAEQLEKLLEQLCSVLDHIHQHGIVHTDIKPENILVRADNTFVLADFGIAWFDPDLHEREKLTKKGDRLANFMFSAPEQMKATVIPTPAADIYALGQTVYWSVTQQVVRGTNYPPLVQFGEEYSRFDPILHRMLQQEPPSRYQIGLDVIGDLYNKKKLQEKEQQRTRQDRHILWCIAEFEERVRRVMPGKEGITHVEDQILINKLLFSVSEDCNEWELWWTRGDGNLPINKMRRLDTGVWLIGNIETQITDMWVGRNHTLDQCFILLRSDPMPTFGVYESSMDTEEVGLYKDRHVTLGEYGDGYAIIDGESVNIGGQAERRVRHLVPYYLFLATKYNPILLSLRNSDADKIVEEVVSNIEREDRIMVEWLEPLMHLPKHERSQFYD